MYQGHGQKTTAMHQLHLMALTERLVMHAVCGQRIHQQQTVPHQRGPRACIHRRKWRQDFVSSGAKGGAGRPGH